MLPKFNNSKFYFVIHHPFSLLKMADCMHESGVLIVKDPRVSMADNETFLNMLERYFEQPPELKKKGQHNKSINK